jgi:predicted RNA-binding protein associated with RNAse of E/G family
MMMKLIKQSHRGETLHEYSGEVRARGEGWVCVVARFDLPDKVRDYVTFRRGDTFVEWHYSDRWYNVFELHDVDDGHLKGWYCNVTRPAVITEDTVRADDLALDVFISPGGAIRVLDEDEFAELDLTPEDQRGALAAVEAIRQAVAAGAPPFEQARRG